MDKHIFLDFCKELKGHGLQASKTITVEEQVAMFLMILAHSNSVRDNAEDFQHSTTTISKYFSIVLNAVNRFAKLVIVPPNLYDVPPQILHNPRFNPYFKDCIGAIDGVHIDAVIPTAQQTPFRGRKTRFTYVMAGWEGIANDSRVLSKTAHFQEMRRRGGPKGREELFNYRHSSLRNVIERCFGVLKKRFPILKNMCSYSFRKQTLIVIACCAIHNYIRMHAQEDSLFAQFQDCDDEAGAGEGVVRTEFSNTSTQVREMAEKRDAIANHIWSDYNANN
ncbi:hypothetical protein LINGRAHAP2_LOCUS15035 [Linum grandiflorum]